MQRPDSPSPLEAVRLIQRDQPGAPHAPRGKTQPHKDAWDLGRKWFSRPESPYAFGRSR